MTTKRRIAILMLAVCVLAGGVTVAVLAKGDRLHAKPRREWKDQAIAKIKRRRIHDLFIGRGSDGKWYYSTFHFCIGMTVLRHMEQWRPDTLPQFADAYLLVPFDGRSDECLKATWTGAEPYGEAKLQMAGTTNPAP